MATFTVTWEINIEANTPQEAAEKALKIQRNPDSTATVFEIVNEDTNETTTIDLLDEDEPMVFKTEYGDVECHPFTDVDPDVNGVEIYFDGGRVGSMLATLPYPQDIPAVEAFTKELEEWLYENNIV